MATQENLELAQSLYVAYYGRPADQAGQEYWAEEIEANGAAAVINAFGTSDEYNARFGDLSDEQLVNNLYQQMFGRDAEQEGLDFYVDMLESGESSLAEIALDIFNGAQGDDLATIENKVEAAQAFTDEAGSAYTGDAAAEHGAEFLEGVDADTDVSSLDVEGAVEDIPSGDGDGNGSNTIDIDFRNTDSAEGYVAETDGNTTTVSNIGKIEWDEAGQVATSSKDYTFHLADQLGAEESYEGLFLSPVLTAEDRTANSQLFIDLLDLRTANTDRPLGDLPVNGFRFSVNGEEVVLQSEDIFNAETYTELLTAVNDALDASNNPLLDGFAATLGGEFEATDDNGQTVSGTTLVLTDSNGGVIEEGNFTYSDDASAGGFTLYGEQSTEAPENIQELIETNVDLDNIGYGSQGASLNLVGQSNSDKGIEQINLSAQNGVWLTRLESSNGSDFLKELNLSGESYFKVGTQDNENVHGLEDVLSGNGEFGLVDVQDVNGGDFGGDIKLSANITEEVVARDLNAQDTDVDPKDDNATFNYTTSAGNDQISLAVSDDVMAREDVNLVIDSGAGDDVVETIFVTDTNDLTDQQLNANQTIATGAGDDVVRTWGQGDAVIGTGTGDDVVYADNSGDGDTTDPDNGLQRDVWEFNSTAAAGAAPTGVSNSDNELSGGVTTLVDQTYSVQEGAAVQVQVTFKGHESMWIDVPSTDGGDNGDTISTLQVNQAIKDAVNNDHVLGNLLEASDGDGNILDIASLIDGDNRDALEIAFRDNNPDTDADTNGDLDGIEAIYAEETGSDNAAAHNDGGAISGAESDNTINAGEGDDVLVLGTGAESNDTLVLSGEFGNDDIVNFTADTGNNADILDFTSYGVNGGTVGSATNVGGVVNDSVNIIDFGDITGLDANSNFGNLTAAEVKTSFSTGAANGKVDSILMVQNANNEGEYKVFDLNSANNSTEYTVDLVGTLDFGESQALVDANIA